MRPEKKYIIKNLTRLLLFKTFNLSQHFIIAKSLKSSVKASFKEITVCKFNAPKSISKKDMHFLLTLILVKETAQYLERRVKETDYSLNSKTKIKTLNNLYPVLIKEINLIFSSYKLYKSFLDFFFLLQKVVKCNLSIHFLRVVKRALLVK